MTRIKRIYKFDEYEGVIDLDIDSQNRVALLCRQGDTVSIKVCGSIWFQYKNEDAKHLRHIRWTEDSKVVVWSFFTSNSRSHSALRLGQCHQEILPFGTPRNIYSGGGLLFASYAEDLVLSALPHEIEYQLVAAFSESGDLLAGFQTSLDRAGYEDNPIDVQAACVSEQGIMYLLAYPENYIFSFDPRTTKMRRFKLEEHTGNILAISIKGKNLLLASQFEEKIIFFRTKIDGDAILKNKQTTFCEIDANEYSDIEKFKIRDTSDGRLIIQTEESVYIISI